MRASPELQLGSGHSPAIFAVSFSTQTQIQGVQMTFNRGDRVVALESIGTGPFSGSIKAGTKGVVTQSSGPFNHPKVAFEGHKGEHSVSNDKLQKN